MSGTKKYKKYLASVPVVTDFDLGEFLQQVEHPILEVFERLLGLSRNDLQFSLLRRPGDGFDQLDVFSKKLVDPEKVKEIRLH